MTDDLFIHTIHPTSHDLGGFKVHRTLPSRPRTMVGPFIFFDQMGPAHLEVGTGIDVRPFSQELMRGAREASEQLLSDEASGDGTYAKVLESWRSFRDASNGWFATAEYEYQKFTFGS